MGSRQLCRGRGRGRGREVEAEARQGRNVLNWGEARQRQRQRAWGRGEAERNRCCLCHFEKLISKYLISCTMHNAHVVVTCSCFVVNDIYQWKTLQRRFLNSRLYQIPDRAKTEAETMRQSRGRGSKVETEARPRQDRVRPRRDQAR